MLLETVARRGGTQRLDCPLILDYYIYIYIFFFMYFLFLRVFAADEL